MPGIKGSLNGKYAPTSVAEVAKTFGGSGNACETLGAFRYQ